ncbi:Membrane protein [Shewanella piezotolerans WP3]|uniref:Membrane protein n=1 Tax=Shewanella piezotolerans (strain WP3 / JCM 13877) TaxID=225849 RepID=B8CTM2_SHEPW|nr:DMT family transporter [Shewanella piezotolerans]ACJ31266.1 Membrane protein [Shewanella piezotolerans WP3]
MTRISATSFSNHNTKLQGFSLAILGAVLMSIDPIFIRFAGVSGFDTAFLFGLFTAISMPIVLQLNDKRGLVQAIKLSGWPLLLTASLMVGSAAGLVFSIKNTSIANTFVILSATPALAAVFSWLLLREITSRATWLSIIAVMIGISVVVSGSVGSGNWFGDLLALLSVTCLAIMFTLLRKYRDVSRLATVGLGGMLLAIVMLFFATPTEYNLNTWLIMAAMGLFTAPICRVLAMVATRHITAAEVSMTMMLETVLAPIWALLFFNEIPALESLIGGGIILITVFFYTLSSMQTHNNSRQAK